MRRPTLREAERCIQCVKPTCIEGCPVRIDIPRFIRHPDGARPATAALAAITNRVPSLDLRARLPAGEPVRGAVRADQGAHGAGGHRPARALRRRSRRPRSPRARSGWAGPRRAAWRSSARPRRAGAAADPRRRLRRHGVRGAARGGRRAALRHPSFRLPRDVIERELQQLRDAGVEVPDQQGHRQDLRHPAADGAHGLRRGIHRRRRRAPLFLGLPGESAGRCSRPTSSSRAST